MNFSNLRVTRAVTPGRIVLVTGKELSAVLAECAARTEIARAGIEAARQKQEEAIARQEVATAQMEEIEARWKKRMAEDEQWAKRTFAELNDQRDERRALLEAIFRVIDRLDQQSPPPPNLRSV
jgi:chromosome segregation ATPase